MSGRVPLHLSAKLSFFLANWIFGWERLRDELETCLGTWSLAQALLSRGLSRVGQRIWKGRIIHFKSYVTVLHKKLHPCPLLADEPEHSHFVHVPGFMRWNMWDGGASVAWDSSQVKLSLLLLPPFRSWHRHSESEPPRRLLAAMDCRNEKR